MGPHSVMQWAEQLLTSAFYSWETDSRVPAGSSIWAFPPGKWQPGPREPPRRQITAFVLWGSPCGQRWP